MKWYSQEEEEAGTGYIGIFQPHTRDQTHRDWTWRKLGSVLDSESFREAFMEDPKQYVYSLRYTGHWERQARLSLQRDPLPPKPLETSLECTVERSLIRYVRDYSY